MSGDPTAGPGAFVLHAGTVVAGGQVHRSGRLLIRGGSVVEVNPAAAAGLPVVDVGAECVVVPGFVDIHCHGGGGADVASGAAAARVVREVHLAHGTTSLCASLVSAQPDALLAQVAELAALVEAGELAGIHLEGPWLAPRRRGAHDPTALRDPDPAEIRRLLDAGGGAVRMVTIAPELPGAPAAISLLREHGVVAAVGHTDATYAQTRDAIAAGASVGTHLFNAMRPIKHREPGPVVALLEDESTVVEVIADGVHLHPATFEQVRRWAGPDRVALVTDAMAAAAMPDGSYHLGKLPVVVSGHQARIAGTDTIAGSTTTMDAVFRAAAGSGTDDELITAVAESSRVPATALGLGRRDLAPGTVADLVVLGADLTPRAVLERGRWAWSTTEAPIERTGR